MKPKVPKQTETQLVKACLAYLQTRRILAWRQNCGAGKIGNRFVRYTSINGISDVLAVLPTAGWNEGGKLLCVECKVGKNKPTDDQASFLAAVNDAGAVGLVVRDVSELVAFIDAYFDGVKLPTVTK